MGDVDRREWARLYTQLRALLPGGTPRHRGEDAIQTVMMALWRCGRVMPDNPKAYLRVCLRRALAKLTRDEGVVSPSGSLRDDHDLEAEVARRDEERRVIAELAARAPKMTAAALTPGGWRQRAQLRKMVRGGGGK